MTQDEMTALFNMGIAVGRQLDSLNKQLTELKEDNVVLNTSLGKTELMGG